MPFLLRSRMILSAHCKEARTEPQEYESQQVTLYGAGKLGGIVSNPVISKVREGGLAKRLS
ncbi:hypothetical protein SD66_07025 [Enterobacter cloacae]|nr:hypothetical protein SD66_07025 [Enterobacter cloacae]